MGFVAILLLVIASFGFSVYENNRAEQQARMLVNQARESAFLIGHTGQQIALLHARTEEAVLQESGDFAESMLRIDEVEDDLDADLRALSTVLGGDEADRWKEIAPMVVELRASLDEVLRAARAGRRADAASMLEQTTPTSVRLFDQLEALYRRGDLETQTALAEAHQRAQFARDLEVVAGFALLLGTVLVAIAVARMASRDQAKLDLYIDRVESSNRDLEAFAGRVAHDLKNVLSPLRLAGPMLLDAANEPDTVKSIAERNDRVTRRAVDLLEGLLAFARAGAAPSFTEKASVKLELAAVLEELSPLVESVSGRAELTIDESVAVRCSPSLLHVLLINVVSNAFKFLQGCEERVVRVQARADGPVCVIEVEDTGPGIPRSALDRVFEPFFRAQGVRAQGVGIGLATVRRIVDAHHGKVAIESTEGVGTLVRLELPSFASTPTTTAEKIAPNSRRAGRESESNDAHHT
ncbi:MAG: HAMP domain-containing histidine kinase, partial [Polyangiaceae bacterium]|nr:HAMP domain-containing histidine kinase [Polyangiaceae bacterium]